MDFEADTVIGFRLISRLT